jgi:uncharacterized protein with GYD domain
MFFWFYCIDRASSWIIFIKGVAMPRYLVQASYTPAAAAAFVNNPQDRVAGVRALAQKMGGSLESMDYCLGDYDLVAVATLPDDLTAAAMALAVNSAGHIKSYKTTRLMSAEEFLLAQQKAHGVAYQAPKS